MAYLVDLNAARVRYPQNPKKNAVRHSIPPEPNKNAVKPPNNPQNPNIERGGAFNTPELDKNAVKHLLRTQTRMR